eukprot:SAG11_NODE_4937_length_1717_cov_2.101978_3_plen_203_part_01
MRDISTTVLIPYGVARCEISWTHWSIDSRDGEPDSLMIDGEEVWQYDGHYGCDGWHQGPADFTDSQAHAGTRYDSICYLDVSVEVPCSGTMEVHFHSNIDQEEADESWAFSDFEVHEYGREDRLNTIMQFEEQCYQNAEMNMDAIFEAIDSAVCPDLDRGEPTFFQGPFANPEEARQACLDDNKDVIRITDDELNTQVMELLS